MYERGKGVPREEVMVISQKHVMNNVQALYRSSSYTSVYQQTALRNVRRLHLFRVSHTTTTTTADNGIIPTAPPTPPQLIG